MTTTNAAPASRRIGGERATMASLAVRELRQMILDGEIKPGERLNEVLIAESLGISRGPLREAIQRLTAEGLLTVITHKGAFVPAISPEELRHLYELRIAIESAALRLGVTRATEEQLDDLRRDLEHTKEVLDSGSDKAYPADVEIHSQLVALAHNPAFDATIRDVHSRIHLARARSATDPERARAAHREHTVILAAIEAGDGETAAALLTDHLNSACENAIRRLDA
jgi:DNA-binding GntR family transcriptional regulator